MHAPKLRSGTVRARIAALPSEVPRILESLSQAELGTITYPDAGFVYAIGGDVAATGAIGEAAGGSDLLYEALPLDARRERDVFGPAGAAGKIAASLKQRFDPAGILNPGRFQGRL